MKQFFYIVLIITIAILHVHLNMNTVENPLNPSFWSFFFVEAFHLGMSLSNTVLDYVVMAIQCVVTSCFALLIAKWNKKWIWAVSYALCIPIYMMLRNYGFAFDNESELYQWYLVNYRYPALPIIVRYSIIQILYIFLYIVITVVWERYKHFRLSQRVTNMNNHNSNMKSAVFVLALFGYTSASAQINPTQGYIITNEGDTIHGTIDYRSDAKNARECHFMAEGQKEYKTFAPADIKGYRFADNGIYYITRTFAVDGQQKTFFAEYLLQGGVSLYRHKENDTDYYFLVGEDGRVGTVKNDDVLIASPKEADKAKREALREASQIFAKSSKAQRELWLREITAENLTKITRDYDMEYCTTAGDCVQFRYDSKKSRSIQVKLRIQAALGIGINSLEPTKDAYDKENNQTMTALVPQIGIGADFLFPRSNKHWSLQALALLSYWSMSKEMRDLYYSKEGEISELKYLNLEFQLGAAYSFKPANNISPVVRVGLAAEQSISPRIKNLVGYHVGKGTEEMHAAVGFYLGAGTDVAIGRHILRMTAEYKWTRSSFSGLSSNYISLCTGIRL